MVVETRPEEHRAAPESLGGKAGKGAAGSSVERSRRRPAVLLRFGRRRLAHMLIFSPLIRRILVLNVVALGILVIGLGYLGEYQRNLIASRLESLTTQARIFAGALGESAVVEVGEGKLELDPNRSRILLRRLIEPTRARARLFASTGELIADSRYLAVRGAVQVEPLPSPFEQGLFERFLDRVRTWLVRAVPSLGELTRYQEHATQQASDYKEVGKALVGESAQTIYSNGTQGLILSVAVPVQRYKRVMGALMVSEGSSEIDKAIQSVRLGILKAFAVALLITTFFSVYLGSTIVRPIRRLAQAAERIGPGQERSGEIPDLTGRGDEIGDLSGTLRRMTELLSRRMEAIERFAADVAHEIKNPLSSLRSAVETAARVKEPEQQRRLMGIILEDVQRLDRLISDISDVSRLDAELSRAAIEPVELRGLLATLVEVYNGSIKPGGSQLRLIAEDGGQPLPVRGLEGRLAQVFRNLIENAISFSPPGGTITLTVHRYGDIVETTVEDEGPGLPEGKFEAIFERFYTERPSGEKFGKHSGLGLSISKQIVEAHGGTIHAENRHDRSGRVRGARFIVRLPVEREADQARD